MSKHNKNLRVAVENGDRLLCEGAATDVWLIAEPHPGINISPTQKIRKVMRVVQADFQGTDEDRKEWNILYEEFSHSIELWATLQHSNIIQIQHDPSNDLAFLSEYIQAGDLRTYVANGISEPTACFVAKNILRGLTYLHQHTPTIVHGNLNAGKIFVDSTGVPKLGEFGLAALTTKFPDLVPAISHVGLVRWTSPEQFEQDSECPVPTVTSDIWATGCTLLEMVTRQLPYSPYKHDSRVTQKIIQGELPGHRPDMGGTRSLSEPDAIWDIIDQCWSAADLRPSARYLLGQLDESEQHGHRPRFDTLSPVMKITPSYSGDAEPKESTELKSRLGDDSNSSHASYSTTRHKTRPSLLTLRSLTRPPSLNRPQGPTVVDSAEFPWYYSSMFQPYTGASSNEPCAKRALIVSIEYLDGQTFADGRSMNLLGCHADAADVLELLLGVKGEYAPQDIRILADLPGLPSSQKPTRENIICGLRWLASCCLAGDRRFFHYTGHGTQVFDLDRDEEDEFNEAIQPLDWSTKYRRGDDGLIIDDEFRQLLVDCLPKGSTLTALVDCCYVGTILDMERETLAKLPQLPKTRHSVPSTPSKTISALTLKIGRTKYRGGASPLGNFLKLPEIAKVKDLDEPVSPGADRVPTTANEYVILEKKRVESPMKRTYLPIVANVVCWSAGLDSQLAWSQPQEISDDRGVLTSAFTTGMQGAVANYNAIPGGFNTEKRGSTYAELFDYIQTQERAAYEVRKNSDSIVQFYQDPQLWISASVEDIMGSII